MRYEASISSAYDDQRHHALKRLIRNPLDYCSLTVADGNPLTLLLMKGIQLKVVSELLDHASVTITLDTYSHVLPDVQDGAAGAMDDTMDDILRD